MPVLLTFYRKKSSSLYLGHYQKGENERLIKQSCFFFKLEKTLICVCGEDCYIINMSAKYVC